MSVQNPIPHSTQDERRSTRAGSLFAGDEEVIWRREGDKWRSSWISNSVESSSRTSSSTERSRGLASKIVWPSIWSCSEDFTGPGRSYTFTSLTFCLFTHPRLSPLPFLDSHVLSSHLLFFLFKTERSGSTDRPRLDQDTSDHAPSSQQLESVQAYVISKAKHQTKKWKIWRTNLGSSPW